MARMKGRLFNSLVEQSLGIRLPKRMVDSISYSDLPPDTQNFIIRMLALMKRSGYSATGFSPILIRWLSGAIPSLLPSAWGGRIPPITLPDRHKNIDVFVAKQKRTQGKNPHIFVDMGCGFPPVTSADTARKLTDWHVYGVDRSFAAYVLYDIDGHYACFDKNGIFQYFQGLTNNSGRFLYADPVAAKNRFKKLFEDLLPLLPDSDGAKSEAVEKDGNRLIHNHILDFETDNLTFIKSDIKDLSVQPAKVIRCMNVLIYFKPESRKKMLLRAGKLLDDDGILITGTNGLGIQSRYAVYQKGNAGLFPRKFAFSLDNLGHIAFMPWFTIHKDDREAMLLAKLMGVLRADSSFWPEFSNAMDGLLKHHSICRRGPDGFLKFPDKEMSRAEYMGKNALLWRQMADNGYLEKTVDVLKKAGYDAWCNSAGDISIWPHVNALP